MRVNLQSSIYSSQQVAVLSDKKLRNKYADYQESNVNVNVNVDL